MRALLFALPAALALAGCSSSDDEAPNPTEASPAAPFSDATKPAAAPNRAAQDDGTGIPAGLQGAWGLVPADCEAGRADAKGLLVVDADSLEFYESMATLGEVAERAPTRIRANFAFSGEGMSWEREMELASPYGGETMIRREFGEEAIAEPLEYTRCT